MLFAGSIRDNVLFGRSSAQPTDENVRQALELAQASEFVGKLPDGAESPIAQGGSNVSGGQKQRLSIARALARRPEILIFDDSFSALDYRTDAALRRAIAQSTEDMTVLIVSQRAGSIKQADEIIVLDDGRLAGMGTHEALMATCPVYREICLSQLSEKEAGEK